MNEKIKRLAKLKQQCFSCKKCLIACGDARVSSPHVFGCGNVSARIVVVGQNPGYNETIIKKPFVGDAGKNFDQFLQSILGIERKYIYITNTIKCYTPGNRPPTDQEIAACKDFLKQEIEIIQPQIVITLGNYALQYFTKHGGITKRHGEVERSEEFSVDIFPMYHPSPLNMNKPVTRAEAEEDFRKLKVILGGTLNKVSDISEDLDI
jgi:DNA polymerase